MKRLIACVVFIVLVCSGSEIQAQPPYELQVHGHDNCIYLDNSPGVRMRLADGASYVITASGNAYYESGSPFKNLLYRHSHSSGADITRILGIGSDDTLHQGWADPRYSFYVMLIDWSDLSDNTGTVTLDTNGYPGPSVDAKSNCITLTSSPATITTVPPGEYTVEFSGNAYYVGPNGQFREVVIHYKGVSGDITDIVSKGFTKQISLRSGSPNVAGFFVDWCTLDDNGGTGVITLTPVSGGNIPTLSEWGLIIFGVVLLGFISWVFLRRRKVIGVRI